MIMGKRKTLEELEAAAKAAEKRARELRAQAKKVTEAEEAKVNAEIIKALKEWLATWPDDKKKAWDELPDYFRKRADENRAKAGQHHRGITQADIKAAFANDEKG
jgi:predicted  nucleic acid-binding Zn-ribbon protein